MREVLFGIATIQSAVLLALAAAPADAAALVVNGGFESGDSGFTSGYTYRHGNEIPAGVYDIAGDPKPENSAWTSFGPHTGSLMMIVNGADVPNVPVWSEAGIPVVPGTIYYFTTWIASNYATSPAKLDFSANGVQLGSAFSGSATTGLWQEFYATWFSGSATGVTLSLVNQNTAFNGNDFSLDDISLTTASLGGTTVGGTTAVTLPEPAGAAILAAALAGLTVIRLGRVRSR